jgi:hypothetical protein
VEPVPRMGRMDSNADSNGTQFVPVREYPLTYGNWL